MMPTLPSLHAAFLLSAAAAATPAIPQGATDRVAPVPFPSVRVTGGFWAPRFQTNRTVTVRFDFDKCAETGRLSNFAKAGGLIDGAFEGIYFNDSDVYKVIEGAASTLATHEDPALDAFLDERIAEIAAAQRDDGYLNTYYTLVEPDQRWTDLRNKHELYCAGHLFEAAVAHHAATGKRSLLDVATRLADHIDARFGPDARHDVPGHQEIEIGLCKLYRATGERRYLDLARFFLDQRGRPRDSGSYGPYCQDHMPVTEQREAVGHAVRAGYMYSGMADVAAATGDTHYVDALDALWSDVVVKKMYLTGGVGSRGGGEAFGDAYELPNRTAYNETCAAIAFAMWNHRMFVVHEDARYLDVLERVLYNGFLAGISLGGDRFFYPNPLEADGKRGFNMGAPTRQAWFGCSCCPVNVVRFVPAIAGYVYATKPDALFVNLFVEGEVTVDLGGQDVRIVQRTRYPWSGDVRIDVHPAAARDFTLLVRIPGWARGEPVPGDLYRYLDPAPGEVALEVNGAPAPLDIRQGFARIRRTWQDDDRVVLSLPMPIRRVVAHPNVAADAGKVALERGPIVYCIEGVDHDGRVLDLALPDDAALTTEHRPDLLGGVTVLRGTASARVRGDTTDTAQAVRSKPVELTALPYYAWSHRGPGEMAVWLPRDVRDVRPPPDPTVTASASHVFASDSAAALNDELVPQSSIDHSIPRLTWWDHRGTTEWAQYDFAEPRELSAAEVYWFDDTGRGACRVPRSWRLWWRPAGAGDDGWRAVTGASGYGVDEDRFNRVTFDPVDAAALRLEVELRDGFSGGILEWRVR